MAKKIDARILDKTHLGFFTKSSIVNMFEREEFVLENICGIDAELGVPNVSRRWWRVYKLADTVSFGRIDDIGFLQFAGVAKPADDSSIQ
jgi:hypothetical protein